MRRVIVSLLLLSLLVACSSSDPVVTIQPSENQIAESEPEEIKPTFAYQQYFMPNVDFELSEDWVTVKADGLPNHETGDFPNANNPNTISEQSYEFRFPRKPQKTDKMTQVRISGFAINGVKMEPATAESYRGEGEWTYEAFQDEIDLGLDLSNAHVQPNGAYHYHGVPRAIVSGDPYALVGWAVDGFPMYVDNTKKLQSGYQIKSGERPDGPSGAYDGTFTQDFEYVGGPLDECNGAVVQTYEFPEGIYAYFVTEEFPYITRCVWGTPEAEFVANERTTNVAPSRPENEQPSSPQSGPPLEAVDACSGKSDGELCTFQAPRGSVTGKCSSSPDGFLCIPH